MENRISLKELHLEGFKSFDAKGQTIRFGDVTVLIGANGAGKSNLIAFFKMLGRIMEGTLQAFIAEEGYADGMLYFGTKRSDAMTARLRFAAGELGEEYEFTLSHAAGDSLIFSDEKIILRQTSDAPPEEILLGVGRKEAGLRDPLPERDETRRCVFDLLRTCRVFQFHDTSNTAKIRNQSYVGDNHSLRPDGGNLASFLHAMNQTPDRVKYYERIVRRIQLVMPQFRDFDLRPSAMNENYVRLDWRETESDYLFGPHQLSDGSLRFMALTTLLLQPPGTMPRVIVLDEPELGLHPAAVSALAGMVRGAGRYAQIVLATQSPRLVDEFTPAEIIVVERDAAARRSVLAQLDEPALTEWLAEYSLGELWEKNILGGRP